MAKWSVVCTVKSTKLYVSHFIAHYVALGAEEIFLYFDDPDCADYCEKAAQGRVNATICDSQYWTKTKRRKRSIEARQMANYFEAKSKVQSDWLLHVDIDELLHTHSDVGAILDNLSQDTFSMIVPPMEAIWEKAPHGLEVFQTPWFRRKLPRHRTKPVKRVYRPQVAAMMRNGMFGHRRKIRH